MVTDDKTYKLFIVEDDDWYNRLLAYTLNGPHSFEIVRFFNAQDMLAELHQSPDVITIDYRLPDMTGDELLVELDRRCVHIEAEGENLHLKDPTGTLTTELKAEINKKRPNCSGA